MRDKDGNIVTGKDGAMTVSEWVASLKEQAPHLFPESVGAGANGSKTKTSLTGIDAKIAAAAAAGNVQEYRRLKAVRAEQQKKNE